MCYKRPGRLHTIHGKTPVNEFNLGLQSVGEKMTPDLEAVMGRCNNMQDVRQVAKEYPSFKDTFQDSIEPVKVLLASVFSTLETKRPTNEQLHSSIFF